MRDDYDGLGPNDESDSQAGFYSFVRAAARLDYSKMFGGCTLFSRPSDLPVQVYLKKSQAVARAKLLCESERAAASRV